MTDRARLSIACEACNQASMEPHVNGTLRCGTCGHEQKAPQTARTGTSTHSRLASLGADALAGH